MENNYKILISGQYNVFNDGWNSCGIYASSGLYISQTFKYPMYIGSAVDLQHRIEEEHIHMLERNKHPHNPPLQNAWNKHAGKEGFVWYLLETCEPEKTKKREQVYLDLYRPFVDEFGGLNIAHFAIGWEKGHIPWNKGKEWHERRGENHHNYGKKMPKELKNELSKIHKGNKYRYGKQHTKESIQKMKNSQKKRFKTETIYNKGKKLSQEHKDKIGKANKGKNSGKDNYLFGKKIPKEIVEKMSKKRQRKVICVEINKIYDSVKKAQEELKISNISQKCSGKYKYETANGFHWKYLEDYQKEQNLLNSNNNLNTS